MDDARSSHVAKPGPEEPDAVVPQVRICEGGGEQSPQILEGLNARGEAPRRGSLTLSEAVSEFLATKDLSPASQKDYKGSFGMLTARAVM